MDVTDPTMYAEHLTDDELKAEAIRRGLLPDPLKVRLIAAREVFQKARNQIRYEQSRGEIGDSEVSQYIGIVDSIEPLAAPDGVNLDTAGSLSAEHVEAVEAAVFALRNKAIELRHEGAICSGGLGRFLEACGLEPYDY